MDQADPWVNGLIDRATEEAILRAIGDLLRRVRLNSGLALHELATRCGVSQSVLCRVELARRAPGLPFLLNVCARLGIRASDLFRAAEDAAVPLPAVSQSTAPQPDEPRSGRFYELLEASGS
jgi:transcriptional regulator with XRE-family HTH domain